MKVLNRPMFRYGGPIKEGVMSGIREPKKNGGSMSQLVKPNNDGSRPGYAGPLAIPAFMGLNALRMGAMRMAPRAIQGIRNFFQTQKPAPYSTIKIGQSKGGKLLNLKPKVIRNVKDTVPKKQVGTVYETKPFFKNDPTFMLASGIYKGITNPKAKGLLASGARLVYNPTGAVTGLYLAGKYFNKDGKETPPPPDSTVGGTSGAPGGGDPGMYLEPQVKERGGGVELTAEERRKKNVERYRDIMDIKGMNKEAAYDSLIAASQAVNQAGGDLKGSIRDGSLINQIIQSTSKAFDKPKATKDAIDTLILKGEIEKDINASDPKSIADLAYKKAATQKLNKELAGNTTAEIIQARMLKDDMPSGSNLASLISINNPELNIKVLPTKDLGNADPVDYMTEIVATVNADETTPDYPAGVYVLKDKVIQITEEGSVIPVPINALK